MDSRLTGGLGASLGELPLDRAVVVSESDSLASVARALDARGVSCALLVELPLRVVTERDLAHAWTQGCTADDEVAAVATERPHWARASASIAEAAAMMVDLGVRHLVVLDDANLPVGVVSMTELFCVLVATQEPAALYASFATVLLRPGPGREPGANR